jgi:hypothetical protein
MLFSPKETMRVSSKFHGKWRTGLLIWGLLVVLVAAGVCFLHVDTPSKAGATAALRPATASVGHTILATGSHFPSQEWVKVYFQNPDRGIITAVTNATGSFSVPLTVPLAYVPGDRYYVYVNSDVYNTRLVFHFAKPGLSLTDSTTHPPFVSSTSFTGKGFRPGEQVILAWNYASGSTLSAGTVVAGTDGSFSTVLTIPSIPYATQCKLVATGYTSNFTASVAITGAPGLVYHPSSASAGVMVTVSGGSFAIGELVAYPSLKVAVKQIKCEGVRGLPPTRLRPLRIQTGGSGRSKKETINGEDHFEMNKRSLQW